MRSASVFCMSLVTLDGCEFDINDKFSDEMEDVTLSLHDGFNDPFRLDVDAEDGIRLKFTKFTILN